MEDLEEVLVCDEARETVVLEDCLEVLRVADADCSSLGRLRDDVEVCERLLLAEVDVCE